MHIGIIAPYSRPWDSEDAEGSGMNVFIKESAEAFAEAGHKVTVFIRKSRVNEKETEQINDLITLCKIEAGEATQLGRDEVYNSCVENNFSQDFVSNCDFLIAHYWIAEAWISKIKDNYKGKILYFSHSFFLNPSRTKVSELHNVAELRLMQSVYWCAYSKSEYEVMRRVVNKNRISLFHPGIDPSINLLLENQSKQNNVDKRETVFIGRKNEAKGFDLFVKLAEENPTDKFLAIGRDEMDINLPKNIENISFLPMNKLIDRLSRAKLIICPSRYEHFGLVPLIANVLRIPVIATKEGGAPDVIVEHKTGWFFDGSYEDLKDKYNNFSKIKDFSYPETERGKVMDLFSWSTFVIEVCECVMRPEKVFEGKIMDLNVIPKIMNDRIVNYENVSFAGSVHVIPVTSDGCYILIKEKRPDKDTVVIRVLSGVMEKGETPEETAKREVEEEIGMKIGRLEKLLHINSSGAIFDNRYYFLAYEHSLGFSKLDKTENIKGTVILTKKELSKLVLDGAFGTSLTNIALLKLCGILKLD